MRTTVSATYRARRRVHDRKRVLIAVHIDTDHVIHPLQASRPILRSLARSDDAGLMPRPGQDDRFAVTPGHEELALEHPVVRTDDYLIVDKIPAAEPLVEDDPRGAPSS